MGTVDVFHNKRKGKVKVMETDEAPGEEINLTHKELFKIRIYTVLDTLLS